MRISARITVLFLMASLVAWQGIVLSIPHNHADSSVPQEELLCSASHPSSETSHLHAAGRHLSPHPCLACLLGSTVADVAEAAAIEGTSAAEQAVGSTRADLRSRLDAQLPPQRGPPLTT